MGVRKRGTRANVTDESSPRRVTTFMRRDGGFTSVGMAVAMLLVLALLFSTAQVCWIQSRSADIQVAADSSALAAANVVAEYTVIARVADATVLSLSLLGLSLYAVGAVVACIPGVDVAAEPIFEAADKVMDARDSFSEQAISALEKLQKGLPFLCAANSIAVMGAQADDAGFDTDYLGLALPVPLEGDPVSFPDDEEAEEAGDTMEENSKTAHEAADEAAKEQAEMNEAKQTGFDADCGNASASMYERAARLAQMSGAENPKYSTVDTWGFDVALTRAKTYYSKRIVIETPEGGGIEEQVKSAARKRFYEYAAAELQKGSVTTDTQGITTAYLPLLPKNTEEVRATSLFTENVWPVSSDGVLHATTSCPACGGLTGTGSLADLESGGYLSCPVCDFSITTLGRVPAASTSIDNGFEYHYRICAEAAQRYTEAQRRYSEKSRAAREATDDSLDAFSKAIESLSDKRYDPRPPGRYGCLAVVVDPQEHEAPEALGAFLSEDASISPRFALSAAMLAPEEASEDNNVISSILSRLTEGQDGFSGVGALDGVLDLWGKLLLSYSEGGTAVSEGISSMLESIPLVGGSELSSWAADRLSETVELLGLQPVKMESLKPVVVNSSHVLSQDETGIGSGVISVREAYDSLPGAGSGDLPTALFDGAGALLGEKADTALGGSYTIASFELFEGGPSQDVAIELPDFVCDEVMGKLESFEQSVHDWSSETFGGGRLWE